MLDREIIQPFCNPWAAPIVLVGKDGSGSMRFCVDYHLLNGVTKDVYPLPRLDDTLNALAGSELFSNLDLASGYQLASRRRP